MIYFLLSFLEPNKVYQTTLPLFSLIKIWLSNQIFNLSFTLLSFSFPFCPFPYFPFHFLIQALCEEWNKLIK